MGYINIPQDLFLGSQEMNRLKSFLSDNGFKKLFAQNSIEYGIFDVSKGGNFNNFRVEQGINQGTIKISEGLAVDKNIKFLSYPFKDNIAVPNDNKWYWLKIKQAYSTSEIGTVSIDSNSNLTGVGTKFKEVLRGLPGVQSLIRLEGSVHNTGEYHVAEVIDDTNAVLQGTFQAETGLKLVVVGSFTPGAAPEPEDKEIFKYDSCLLSFVEETVSETPPSYIEGEEFFIARVKNNSGNLIIQDTRERFIYKSKDAFLSLVDQSANPLIGVEAVKWEHPNEAKDRNIIYMAWGFRSQNWSYNPSLNRVTLNSGEGGKYKSTGDFSDNDFNGWRLYTEDGNYCIVRSSFKQGSQINIDLDSTDFKRFSNENQRLLIVPDADGILIRLKPEEAFEEIAEEVFSYPINTFVAKVRGIAYKDPESAFIVRYKYKKGVNYSIERTIPSDPVGYYNESSFNSTGTIKIAEDRVRVPYESSDTVGFIKLEMANNSYKRVVDQFTNGDAFGINITELNNEEPVIRLTPGISKAEQLFDHTSNPIVFEVDQFIDLVTENEDGVSTVKDGNSFTIQFEGGIDLNGNTLKVVTGFINPGQIGTEILSLDQVFLDRAENKNARVKFIYDLETDTWKYFIYNTVTANAAPIGPAGGALSGSYPNPSLSDNSVGTENIQNFSVTNTKLADNSVSTSKINDFSVTGAKIASGSVSNAKLADNAVTESRIANNSVTNSKLAANSLAHNKAVQSTGYPGTASAGLAGMFNISISGLADGWNDPVICNNGVYMVVQTNATPNRPPLTGGSSIIMAVVVNSGSTVFQTCFSIDDLPGIGWRHRSYMRYRAGGTWSSWYANNS